MNGTTKSLLAVNIHRSCGRTAKRKALRNGQTKSMVKASKLVFLDAYKSWPLWKTHFQISFSAACKATLMSTNNEINVVYWLSMT